MIRRVGLVIAAAALAVPLVWLSSRATTRDVKLVAGNAYQPASKTIEVGDTVRWTDEDSTAGVEHSVTNKTSSTETFDSSPNNCPDTSPLADSDCMKNGSTFQHEFDQIGDFGYYCRVHGESMSGVIHVVTKITPTQGQSSAVKPTKSKKPTASASASASAGSSLTASASASAIASPTASATQTTLAGGEKGSGGGAAAKVGIAVGGIVVLGGAGYFVYRRFLSA